MSDPNPKIISYTILSLLIGLLAMLLPFICIIGGKWFGNYPIESSISAYYYTNMRDFLEAILIGVGAFCLCYFGTSRSEHTAYSLTGIFCMFIGVFPCLGSEPDKLVGIFQLPESLSGMFHDISAILFFIMGVVISFRLFPKDAKYSSSYKVCGSGILVGIIVRIILSLIGFTGANAATGSYWVIIVETIMLEIFGIMWIIHSLEGLSKTVAGKATLQA